MKHLNIRVHGLVQGIFFRATAKEQADRLGISGFADNKPDGSVYLEAEGEKEQLDTFVKWCYKGPSLAKVEKVEISESPLKNFSSFEVYKQSL
ncbi:acylphosphatase [Candidatus Daviesbacteria bacterium]|nr:acylphosphatase [Candidatus Daviesbacteria bacterium]